MEEIIKNQHGYYSVKNIPTEVELAEYYEKKYYQAAVGSYEIEYDSEEILYFKNKIEERAYIIEQNLSASNNRRFLDVGCGEGWALNNYKEKGWEVDGLDYSDFGCEKFNSSCQENLIVGNIYSNLKKLIEEKEQFSVVWIDNVLEHVTAPEFLVNEIKAIIEPGGILVIEVPNDFSFIQKHAIDKKLVDNEFWVVTPDHLSYFNKEGLNNLLSSSGYQTIDFIADYPIDINLLNPNTNYVKDRTKGKSCHKERISFENLIHQRSMDDVLDFYRACAQLGLGRQITGFFRM